MATRFSFERYSWNLITIGEFVGCFPILLDSFSVLSPKKDSKVLDNAAKSIWPDFNNKPWFSRFLAWSSLEHCCLWHSCNKVNTVLCQESNGPPKKFAYFYSIFLEISQVFKKISTGKNRYQVFSVQWKFSLEIPC